MIEPTIENVHGVFAANLPPVTTVRSGETVTLRTLDAWWGLEGFTSEYGTRRRLEGANADRGHALTGPIAVEGLRPGETLEVEILRLRPGKYGFTECGGTTWEHYSRLGVDRGGPRMLLWEIDAEKAIARTLLGGSGSAARRAVEVTLRPFMGVMGMPPAAEGEHSTTPPRRTGGNLDCTLLTEGATLYLPVEVAGGLLSVGDGHAAQGDGELSNNGIECPMDEVRLKLTRRTDFPVTGPVVRTPAGWATLGLGPTLDQAMYSAANAMLDLMTTRLGCPRTEALGLMSVAVNFRVTQVVNGVKGVHALWEGKLARD